MWLKQFDRSALQISCCRARMGPHCNTTLEVVGLLAETDISDYVHAASVAERFGLMGVPPSEVEFDKWLPEMIGLEPSGDAWGRIVV